MMATQGGSGSGSGSVSRVEQLDEQMCEFILSDITCNILEQTLVNFGMVQGDYHGGFGGALGIVSL